jgi:hypothetical protein
MPLKNVQNLLDALRRRDVADIVRKKYTGVTEGRVRGSEGENATDANFPTATTTERDFLEHGHVFALKADLSYAGPDGFGEWHIFTTARARGEIEDMKATDGKLFDGMMKKLWYVPSINICATLNASCAAICRMVNSLRPTTSRSRTIAQSTFTGLACREIVVLLYVHPTQEC